MNYEGVFVVCVIGCLFGYWLVSILSGKTLENNRQNLKNNYTKDAEAYCFIIKACVLFAYEKGVIEQNSKNSIARWIKTKTTSEKVNYRESLELLLNSSYSDALLLASPYKDSEPLIFEEITKFRNVGSKAQFLDCVELLFEIISVEKIATPRKINIASRVAMYLNLEPQELKKISDRALVAVSFTFADEHDLDYALGIDKNMSIPDVLKYLREEFSKWNNRLNTMSEPEERTNIQQRLDLIARARKRYGG